MSEFYESSRMQRHGDGRAAWYRWSEVRSRWSRSAKLNGLRQAGDPLHHGFGSKGQAKSAATASARAAVEPHAMANLEPLTRYLPAPLRERLEGRPNLWRILTNVGWLFGDHILRLGAGILVA